MSSQISASRRLRSDERGAVLAETAITIPVILLLVFAIVEIGIYLWQWNAANKATQLGARYAVTSDPVADGPGLTSSPATGAMGTDCRADAANQCLTFEVQCTLVGGCSGTSSIGGAYALVPAAFNEVVAQMQLAYPDLDPNTVSIRYRSNGVGFIGFPGHIPNDVTVQILTEDYAFAVLSGFVNLSALRIRAETSLSSEDLAT